MFGACMELGKFIYQAEQWVPTDFEPSPILVFFKF